MSTRVTLVIAIAGGFIGGMASRSWFPELAHAQAPTPAPAEIRAQKFVLVDAHGVARGVFGIEQNGAPLVEVMDKKGRVWDVRFYPTSVKAFFHDPPMLQGKPTLLPQP